MTEAEIPEDAAKATEQQPAQKRDSWSEPAVRLRDARSLRAFAHPLRVELLSALRIHGALTATQAAAIVDDSPSNCSFHLRTLASFGLIEDIPGTDARQRLWRAVRGGVTFDPDDNAESRVAAKAAAQVFHAHTLNSLSSWMDRESDAPQVWRDAWWDASGTIDVNAQELEEIGARIADILRPYVERRREREAMPDEAPVGFSVFAYPQIMPPDHTTAPPPTAPQPPSTQKPEGAQDVPAS